MLLLLLPLGAGVALGGAYNLPAWFLALAFLMTGVVALLLRSSAALVGLLVVVGFALVHYHTPTRSVPRGVTIALEVRIEGIPVQKERYTRAEGVVEAWREPMQGEWCASASKVVLYADSLTTLTAGERLLCEGRVSPFRADSGTYRQTMERRGYAGSLFLSERRIFQRTPATEGSLQRWAVARFRRLGLPTDEDALLRAMVAGDRSGLSPALRRVYARSGFAHLLALSGLHIGIVFLLVNLLLAWLLLVRWGHLVRNLLAIGALWLFVAMAGFPPSAVRAAVMCSLLQFSLATSSEYVALNAWATAGVGMLLWNPMWLWERSFQLSFLAVGAILVWGVPLCRACRTRWRWCNLLIDSYLIALVATLATAPLISHTFGYLSWVGLLFNPLAILLTSVVVLGGMVWLLLPIGWLSPLFVGVVGSAARGVNGLAQLASSVGGGAVEYTLPTEATWLIYLLFALLTGLLWCAEPKKSVHLSD